MKKFRFFILTIVCISVLFSGCSSSSDSKSKENESQTISGTAAKGAAIVGDIVIYDSIGSSINVLINNDGSFSADVSGMSEPFLLQALPSEISLSKEYSYAAKANTIANITPLSTLAIFLANNSQNLETLASDWQNKAAVFTLESLQEAQKQINTNFSNQFSVNHLNANTYDFFTTAFQANHTGYDALLDSLNINIDMLSGSFYVLVDGALFNYNSSIDTSETTIGGNENDGVGWTLTITGISNIFGQNTDIDMEKIYVPAPPNISDFNEIIKSSYSSTANMNVIPLIDTSTQKKFEVAFNSIADGIDFGYNLVYDYTKN